MKRGLKPCRTPSIVSSSGPRTCPDEEGIDEFSIQLRAFHAGKGGRSLGVAALVALCGALIGKTLRGGLVVVGGLNLGGSIDLPPNAIDVVELAVEKGASVVLMPVSARKQLFDLSDDMATKVNVLFYGDVREALIKAIAD